MNINVIKESDTSKTLSNIGQYLDRWRIVNQSNSPWDLPDACLEVLKGSLEWEKYRYCSDRKILEKFERIDRLISDFKDKLDSYLDELRSKNFQSDSSKSGTDNINEFVDSNEVNWVHQIWSFRDEFLLNTSTLLKLMIDQYPNCQLRLEITRYDDEESIQSEILSQIIELGDLTMKDSSVII